MSPGPTIAADNPKGVPSSAVAFTVVEHVDGDSFFVGGDDGEIQQVDIFGIDAPELKDSGNECFAQEAADYLASLIPLDSTVYLEDEEVEDEDGSWQRDVWMEGKDGGKSALLNTKLVREGYAGGTIDAEEDGKYGDRIGDAVEKAKDGNRGVWKKCGGVHKKIQLTPTPTPSTEEIKAQYAPLADVREMAIRPTGMIGQKIFFYGTIRTIQVATPGYVYNLGDTFALPYTAALQIEVIAPDGSSEWVSVGYDGDTTGMYEGTYVLVYGVLVDTQSGTNAFGGVVQHPLIAAQYVEFA